VDNVSGINIIPPYNLAKRFVISCLEGGLQKIHLWQRVLSLQAKQTFAGSIMVGIRQTITSTVFVMGRLNNHDKRFTDTEFFSENCGV
jgi:hypothetical protein